MFFLPYFFSAIIPVMLISLFFKKINRRMWIISSDFIGIGMIITLFIFYQQYDLLNKKKDSHSTEELIIIVLANILSGLYLGMNLSIVPVYI